ncbi:LAETG motif-containing sortase-dependent surface protein [Streptomyces sp. NPDC005483]|uniref:LAETG motif-containing sortase-dependent surface protein n=1 Tax=Streptomyces sp. NPDC005483 TaxID=3154882 RepID=UPI0033BDFD27
MAGAYHSDDFGHPVTLPGAGKVPANVTEICKLTWACTPKRDPHPNAVGHKVIAAAFAAQFSKVSEPEQQPAPGPSTSSTTGAAKDAAANQNEPTADGELAETGTPSSAPIAAGSGLAAVLVGTGAVYFARRRRTSTQN